MATVTDTVMEKVIQTRDVHNHLLPGVDDGFQKAGDSLEAIRLMAEAGCREIIFTPHLNPDVYPDSNEESLRRAYAAFTPRIPQELGVQTSLAAEYMVVKDFEKRAAQPETLLTWPDGSILIEMSYYYRSPNLEQTIFELRMQGLKPILAHPERYLYMAGSLKDFDEMHEMGCRFQMNLMSLTGCYGDDSVTILRYLSGKGWYDFRATDLHTLHQLNSILSIKEPDKILKKKSFLRKLLGK